MVHFDSYGKVALSLYNNKDEVEVGGVFYSFNYKVESQYRRVYTGVTFLGDKESYIEEERRITDVEFFGAFDEDGEKVDTDFDLNRLKILLTKPLVVN